MSELDLDDLRLIMREAAGEGEDVDLGQDILDVPFTNLGFDSLALMETVALIKRRTGVAIGDDELGEIVTPRALLDKVASRMTGAA